MFSPRVVHIAEVPPHGCVLSGLSTGPFIDTGVDIRPVPFGTPHAYIQLDIAREIGRTAGMVEETTLDIMRKQNLELAAQLERAEQELSDLESSFQAIDHLESKGYTARKKAGRPPKKEAV
jgi:hypothetical protein